MSEIPAEYLNNILTGDARELARAIPDESIDLIFTDPVYERVDDYAWLAELGARVLKRGGWLLCYYGIGYLPETTAALSKYLDYEWHHVSYMPTLRARGPYMTFNKYRGLLRYRKDASRLCEHLCDVQTDLRTFAGHRWAKTPSVVLPLVRACCRPGGVVLDPFAGGGTTAAVCKMLGRNFIASEIDPDTAERARLRVAQTQMPLPGLLEEQSEMELTA